MADQLIPTTQTTPTPTQFARAAMNAEIGISKEAVAVLWSQFACETASGRYCWNWNLGNVKHVNGDGYDYVALKGVWEGVTPDQAQKLIATGKWVADSNPDHAKAVGPGKVSIVASSTNPAAWFRAFSSLDEGMEEHVKFLINRYPKAWEAVLAGDPAAFSKALKARGYYTASESAYTSALLVHFKAFMGQTSYEGAIAGLKDEGTPEWETPQPIVHPAIEFEFFRPTYWDE